MDLSGVRPRDSQQGHPPPNVCELLLAVAAVEWGLASMNGWIMRPRRSGGGVRGLADGFLNDRFVAT